MRNNNPIVIGDGDSSFYQFQPYMTLKLWGKNWKLWFSAGCAATYFAFGGMCYTVFVYNLLLLPALKEIWKSVRFWQNYRHQLVAHVFGSQCTLLSSFCTRYDTTITSSEQCSRCRSHRRLWTAVSACVTPSRLPAEHAAVTSASTDATAWTQSGLLRLGLPLRVAGRTSELAAQHAEGRADVGGDATVWCRLVAT